MTQLTVTFASFVDCFGHRNTNGAVGLHVHSAAVNAETCKILKPNFVSVFTRRALPVAASDAY